MSIEINQPELVSTNSPSGIHGLAEWLQPSEPITPAEPIAVFPDEPTPFVEDFDKLKDKLKDKLERENEDGKGSKTST